MTMFGPRHTFHSTVQLLVKGLEDGSIVLDSEKESVRVSQVTAPVARWRIPQWMAFAVGGSLGAVGMWLLGESAHRIASRLAELLLVVMLGFLTGFFGGLFLRLLIVFVLMIFNRLGEKAMKRDQTRAGHT